ASSPVRWPAGLSAVIVVSFTTVKFVAGVVPKLTAVAPVKPVPMTVTRVPPAAGPLVGLRPVTAGAARNVKRSACDAGDVPAGVVTVTLTIPMPAGLVAVKVVSFTTVRFRAGTGPKSTPAGPVNPVPVTVTNVPPATGPLFGVTPVTVGAAVAAYVNWSACEIGDVPAGFVTVTLTVPVPAGLVTVS